MASQDILINWAPQESRVAIVENGAVQGRIAAWIEHLEGSYSGVMGLPLHETARLLSRVRVRMDV